MIRLAALAGLALVAPGCGRAASAGDTRPCFTAADSRRLTFPVIVQAPPPQPDEADYPFHPLTAAATMQVAMLQAPAAGVDGYFFHWANRANAPLAGQHGRMITRKPNLQPSALAPRRQRTAFSTIAQANGCTMAQLHSLLGDGAAASAIARTAAIALASETAQPDGDAPGPADVCVLPAGVLPRTVKGVVLDYEVADGRSAQATRDFLVGYAAAAHAHGLRAILLTNPLNAPTQAFTAIDAANAGPIIAAFDQTTLMLWSRNREHDLAASYAAQRAIADALGRVDPARLIIDFELAGTTPADAALVHDLIGRDHLGGLMLWRNHAVIGGDCASPVNRRIAIAAFGASPADAGS